MKGSIDAKDIVSLGEAKALMRSETAFHSAQCIQPLTSARDGPMINRLVNHQRLTNAIFGALADPTRRRLLSSLSGGAETPVAALARPFRISAPAISRHLRVLENARLIRRRHQGRLHLIRARPEGLKEAQNWINHYIAGWEFSFNALDNLLKNQRKDDPQ